MAGYQVGYGASERSDEKGNIPVPGKGWLSVKEIWAGLQSGQITAKEAAKVEILVPGRGYFSLDDYVEQFGTDYPPPEA